MLIEVNLTHMPDAPMPDLTSVEEDSRLQVILRFISSNLDFESIYLKGSRAVGEHKDTSDYDLLVLMSVPAIISSIPKMRKMQKTLRNKMDADIQIVSLTALRVNAGSYQIRVFEKYSKLLLGKSVFPLGTGTDPSSIPLYVCEEIKSFLKYIHINQAAMSVDSYGLAKLSREIDTVIRLTKPNDSFTSLGLRLQEESTRADSDPHVICSILADFVEMACSRMKFPRFDQLPYIANVLVEERQMLGRTLFIRTPVRMRFVISMALLLKSASTTPPDMGCLSRISELLGDHIDSALVNDPYKTWNKSCNTLRYYGNKAMRLPFGTIILGRPFYTVLI